MQQAVQRAIEMLKAEQGSPLPLRHDWRQFVYTDGSVLQRADSDDDGNSCPGIGAAVHIPANADTGREALTVAISCEYREDDTVKQEVNTINRAELAAIRVALEFAPEVTSGPAVLLYLN